MTVLSQVTPKPLGTILPPAKPRWHLAYYALGAFNVLSVAAGLYLSGIVLDIYRDSVDDSRRWASRMDSYAQLGQLATVADAPGNDVFESGDVDGEERRLNAAVMAFDDAVLAARRDLSQVSPEERGELRTALDVADSAVREMIEDARGIFAAKRAGDERLAGAKMASMDRNLSEANAALGRLRAEVHRIQDAHFSAQIAAAGQVDDYQHGLLGVVVLMVICVVAYGVKLARVLAAKQAEIDQRNADLRRVLDNVGQGFFTVDRSGVMSSERSTIVTTWFGTAPRGTKIWEFFGRANPKFGEWLRLGWDSVVEDVLPLELALDQLPATLEHNHRHYRIEYRPTTDDGSIQQTLIVVSDVSDQVIREAAEVEQQETLAVFERILSDKFGFIEFFDEADALVCALTSVPSDEARERRLLHTLKGNTSMFGLGSIARRCHDLETAGEDGRRLSAEDRAQLLEHWQRIARRLKTLLGERLNQRLELEQPEYEVVLNAVIEGAPHAEIAERLRSWAMEPAERRLSRIAESARHLARRLNKPHVDIDIDHQYVRLPMDGWAPFWSAITHVVRNALDHGIESSEERTSTGKTPRARLTLTTTAEPGQILVEIRDDGRGIDWTALRDRAAERGITSDDLESLLFVDGLSTRAVAGETSGRGVGMGAVREAAQALGGEIRVMSTPGNGTVVRFSFPTADPLAVMLPLDLERAGSPASA